jgi:Skp family chaperone for outer membrane proteins
MNRILATLLLSTAAIGAAQAGEIGYLDNPGTNAPASLTRDQVQRDLDTNRAGIQAFQGQLDPSLTQARAGNASRAQVAQEQHAQVASPAGAAFVNG